ncbi:hypothetical protein GGTG_00288 [Gaeumannomyces tritici R3-111a-1]|uniref:Uncharacterized protein n=1 Tax=Gaeumannomyces tritici (strain R3-111a-1) TaxID=644352 RepID=J3NG96_GAET3|nr:hypothetical protein GGTG_00288 [Gaeumannomyces tritici R3-111a-1]EJT80286.1 hypothetical protein GGTG_00288 [Gaeumannomyces tritici R3-111a-1]
MDVGFRTHQAAANPGARTVAPVDRDLISASRSTGQNPKADPGHHRLAPLVNLRQP